RLGDDQQGEWPAAKKQRAKKSGNTILAHLSILACFNLCDVSATVITERTYSEQAMTASSATTIQRKVSSLMTRRGAVAAAPNSGDTESPSPHRPACCSSVYSRPLAPGYRRL